VLNKISLSHQKSGVKRRELDLRASGVNGIANSSSSSNNGCCSPSFIVNLRKRCLSFSFSDFKFSNSLFSKIMLLKNRRVGLKLIVKAYNFFVSRESRSGTTACSKPSCWTTRDLNTLARRSVFAEEFNGIFDKSSSGAAKYGSNSS
jgi:hypothetical protein